MKQKKRNQNTKDFSPTVYHFKLKITNVGDEKWRALLSMKSTLI